MITLKRTDYTDKGTRGVLTLPSGTTIHTIELPWRGNSSGTLSGGGSCIPTGEYGLSIDPYYNGGYDAPLVEGVEGRSQIQIHIGNSAADLKGCISPGNATGLYSPGEHSGLPAVWNSADTFHGVLMPALEPQLPTTIEIVSASGSGEPSGMI